MPSSYDFDWSRDRALSLARAAVDLFGEYLGRLRELPVSRRWKEVDLGDLGHVPEDALDEASIVARLRSLVFERSMYPGHPRFMAFITGPGTLPGIVGDFVAAFLNQNVGGYRLAPAATEIERSLVKWFGGRFGLPATCGGIFVSGGAMANFVALKAMRDAKLGVSVRREGVKKHEVAVYASVEVHDVVDRALDMLGLGSDCVRKIPVDPSRRIDLEKLEAAIDRDVARGVRPIAIVGTAGTVATGSIDPLDALGELCVRRSLWFHVDGAYGALAALSDELRPLLRGIERADSIAFDPHKWMYVPHSCGGVVVRDEQRLADAFALHPSYVHEDKARTGHGVDLHTMGPQFSRGFQALKVWLSLLAHGRRGYGARIARDVALAKEMGEKARARPRLEVVSDGPLSICCFRYRPRGLDDARAIDALNERLMTEIQLDGRAFCSNAIVDGRFVLRACIVNFRTESADVDALLDVACELGESLAK